jgi:hypothetical protein
MKHKKITALLGTALILAWAPVSIVKIASAATDYPTTRTNTSNTNSTGTTNNMTNQNLPDLTSLDTDRNGALSLHEFTASGQFDNSLFNRIDTNKDGIISQPEFDTYKRENGQTGSPTTSTP